MEPYFKCSFISRFSCQRRHSARWAMRWGWTMHVLLYSIKLKHSNRRQSTLDIRDWDRTNISCMHNELPIRNGALMLGILILRASDISFQWPRLISFGSSLVTWKLKFDFLQFFYEFPSNFSEKWNEMKYGIIKSILLPDSFTYFCICRREYFVYLQFSSQWNSRRCRRRHVETAHAIRININKFALGLKMSSNYVILFFFALFFSFILRFGSFATFRDRIGCVYASSS